MNFTTRLVDAMVLEMAADPGFATDQYATITLVFPQVTYEEWIQLRPEAMEKWREQQRAERLQRQAADTEPWTPEQVFLYEDFKAQTGGRTSAHAEQKVLEAKRLAAKAKPEGKFVHGTFYRGPKPDRSADPRYEPVPANILIAVAAKRLSGEDAMYAAAIWKHNRRTYRAKKDKSRRLTYAELGVMVGRSDSAAKRSVSRMLKEHELRALKPGQGNVGAVYEFPARSE